jgi:hypothetical protein
MEFCQMFFCKKGRTLRGQYYEKLLEKLISRIRRKRSHFKEEGNFFFRKTRTTLTNGEVSFLIHLRKVAHKCKKQLENTYFLPVLIPFALHQPGELLPLCRYNVLLT